MNELLPYEEKLNQQLDNLILPNEDMAWEDMKRRLKKEDDDKVLPPFWLRGCALWSLSLLLLVGLGWGTYTYVNSKKKNATTTTLKDDKSNTPYKKNTISEEKTNNIKPSTATPISSNPIDNVKNDSNQIENNKKRFAEKASTKITITAPEVFIDIEDTKINSVKQGKSRIKYSEIKNKKKAVKNNKSKNRLVNEDESFDDKNEFVTSKGKSKVKVISASLEDEVTNDKFDKVDTKDSILKKISDTLVKKDNKQADTSKKATPEKEKKKNRLIYIVGIGEQQQLPINGQKATPYNALGRKGSLLDYIPSVYVRVKKEEKWFLQAEFKYGAPQYNKDNFVYQQKIVPDTGFNPLFTTTTSYNLKKTYYHQLPITFNYYIARNWSVGAGVQWNKFFGALAEVDVNRKNNFTQIDSTVSNFTTIDKKDSANLFKKNYFLGIVETQYQWKRFTIGAKYIFGLQPYITFTLPSGSQQKEKSNVALIFIKYQLWQSKNKK
jgi:hypothetical protein